MNGSLLNAKPSVMKAFQFARNTRQKKNADQYISKQEFRSFLVALRQRFEYTLIFQQIDMNGTGKIGLSEFLAAKDLIEKWVGKMEDPIGVFNQIDSNGNGDGLLQFDEFCIWSIK